MTLTIKRLKEVLHYDPLTGSFTWLVQRNSHGGCVKPGAPAGQVLKVGYVNIGLDGNRYYAHRLAWFYVSGKWPTGKIDHIDGDKLNNRLANLRDVSNAANAQNIKGAQRNSVSGFLGVHKNGSGWMARCETRGKQIYLGTFRTKEEAYGAYLDAKRVLHEGCTI